MKTGHPGAIERLIRDLQRLPGIGPKSAERLAYHLLRRRGDGLLEQLTQSLLQVREKVRPCLQCGGLSEISPCEICGDARRDRSKLCVVEDTVDLLAIDRTGIYRGLYHVLGGVLSPLEGVGPEQLNVESLLARARGGEVREILLATNTDVEGEATALYLQGLLRELAVRTTRLATGVPQGGALSYLDGATLSQAIRGRVEFRTEE